MDEKEYFEPLHKDVFGKGIDVGDTVVYFKGSYARWGKSYVKDVITGFSEKGFPRGQDGKVMCYIGVIKYAD